jgi:hypothetical protein
VANHFDVEELLETLNVLVPVEVHKHWHTTAVLELKEDQPGLAGHLVHGSAGWRDDRFVTARREDYVSVCFHGKPRRSDSALTTARTGDGSRSAGKAETLKNCRFCGASYAKLFEIRNFSLSA